MKQKTLILIVVMLFIPSVLAGVPTSGTCPDDIIEVSKNKNTSCTIITPTLSSFDCEAFDYNLTLLPNNIKIVSQGSMTELNDSRYFFNFIQPQGNYTLTLCDGTTQDIMVEEVDDMLIVIYLILGLGIVLLSLAFTFQENMLAWISGLLMFLSGVWIVINGLGGQSNFLTDAFGTCIWAVGAYLFLLAGLAWIKESFGE